MPGRQKKLLGCSLLGGISTLADSMANALLPQVRKYPLTHSNLFDSQLNYGNLVWVQNRNTIKLLTILQKKGWRPMNFEPRNFHISPLFLTLNIFKLPDKIIVQNCLLITQAINNFSSSLINNCLNFHPRHTNMRHHAQLKVYWKFQ